MPGILGGLANAAAGGLVAYSDEQDRKEKEAIRLKAQQWARDRQDRVDADAARARQEQRNDQLLIHGITPAHQETATPAPVDVPLTTPLQTAKPLEASAPMEGTLRATRQVQIPGGPSIDAPSVVSVTENKTPAPGVSTIKQQQAPVTKTVPAAYHEENDPYYNRVTDVAAIQAKARQEAAATRAALQERLATKMAASRKEVAQIQADSRETVADKRAAAVGGAGRQQTGNSLEQHFQRVTAPGLLEEAGGNLQAAVDALNNTEDGRALKAKGFTVEHLAAEYSRRMSGEAAASTRLQSGSTGMTPGEATGAVKKTGQLVRGGAAPVRTAPSTTAAPDGSDIDPKSVTDAEIASAVDAGVDVTNGKLLRAHIKSLRAKKK